MDLLLQSAIKPAGNTLYVWGGGWTNIDTETADTATSLGVRPEWKTFFEKNRTGYSYRPLKQKFESGDTSMCVNGLDCSGFLGWTVYNGVTRDWNFAGYVTKSTYLASSLADMNFGTAANCTKTDAFKPGDIVSLYGHCYMVLGTCSDGSVLIIHSTPDGGVQVSGTVTNGQHSVASKLAADFMKTHYKKWWQSFGSQNKQAVNISYLNGTKFSWDASKITDTDGVRNMSGEQVLNYLSKYANNN